MKKSSIPSLIMVILWEIGKGTVQAFFNPKYAKRYGYSHLYNKQTYTSALSRLQKKEYIRRQDNIYYLTPKGQKEAFFNYLKERGTFIKVEKPERWDKRWRIIFFDIPEKKRRLRDELRLMLKAIGFKEFQKSIWIYPYKVPNFIKEILFDENIKRYTRFITTENIEYDKDIRKLFNIK